MTTTKHKLHFGVGDTKPKGAWRLYYKHAQTSMLRMDEPFTVSNREGENMQGQAGDYLVEDGYGGYHVCGAAFHADNYVEMGL